MFGLAIAAALVLLFPNTALAYLDPGAGSLLLQAAAGAFFVVAVFFGKIRKGIRSLFKKNNRD